MTVVVVLLSVVILAFGAGAIFGAPWVPAFNQDLDELFDLAKLKRGSKFVDLGCGDGKILLAAARRGAIVTGYEINPIMWAIAWLRLRQYRSHANVYFGSYWSHNLTSYDVIWLYLIDHHMPRMAQKIHSQASAKAHIISYIFEFPNIRPFKRTRNSFIYRGKDFMSLSDQIQ